MTTYSSAEVVNAVDGLSYRQLDHWVRKGYITPEVAAGGSGTRRRWSQTQVDHLRAAMSSLGLVDERKHELTRRVLAGELVIVEVSA